MNRRHFLKGLAVSGMATSLLGLTACTPQATDKKIRVGITGRPRMLDPRKATDALSSRINRLIYRQLIDFNDKFEAVPDLAAWQQLSDTHYRFTLLEQPMFHHGKRLTAEDVVATYKSLLVREFGSAHRGSLRGIERIEAVNETQIDFHIAEADALFVGRLVIGILPADLVGIDHPFHVEPIGSGACRFASLDEQQLSVIRLHDQVTLQFIPVKDATVRVLKLEKGELDIVQNDLSPELVQYCQQQQDLTVQWHGGTNYGYIGFNFEDPLLAQPAMRQAIAHGIDRQAIIDSMFSGHARLAQGLLVPEHWSGADDISDYEYNPEKAKSLLQQVDYSSLTGSADATGTLPKIEFSYKTSNDPTRIRLATIYQAQLKKIGIDLSIQSYDWGTFYSDIKKGRFQLYSLAWVGVKSPDIFQYVFDSKAIPPSGANRGRYRDPVADQLIREAGQTSSLSEQARLYRQLQHRLQETLAVMPLWYEDQYSVMRQGITGYRLYADGRLDGLLALQKSI